MTHYGTWVSYTGTARLALAAALLAAAAALTYAGVSPAATPSRPGQARPAKPPCLCSWPGFWR